ncbi:unnamed protein product [Ambrosiozyma monospora]|uniref:Unnamed protein product n=1 Tax=Ambrosiozyma monospora TaxID=43982 RepID=A0ACB5T7E4_AMBMO|nr:unnamed protein product [Ambrosiozyma monospora]
MMENGVDLDHLILSRQQRYQSKQEKGSTRDNYPESGTDDDNEASPPYDDAQDYPDLGTHADTSQQGNVNSETSSSYGSESHDGDSGEDEEYGDDDEDDDDDEKGTKYFEQSSFQGHPFGQSTSSADDEESDEKPREPMQATDFGDDPNGSFFDGLRDSFKPSSSTVNQKKGPTNSTSHFTASAARFAATASRFAGTDSRGDTGPNTRFQKYGKHGGTQDDPIDLDSEPESNPGQSHVSEQEQEQQAPPSPTPILVPDDAPPITHLPTGPRKQRWMGRQRRGQRQRGGIPNLKPPPRHWMPTSPLRSPLRSETGTSTGTDIEGSRSPFKEQEENQVPKSKPSNVNPSKKARVDDGSGSGFGYHGFGPNGGKSSSVLGSTTSVNSGVDSRQSSSAPARTVVDGDEEPEVIYLEELLNNLPDVDNKETNIRSNKKQKQSSVNPDVDSEFASLNDMRTELDKENATRNAESDDNVPHLKRPAEHIDSIDDEIMSDGEGIGHVEIRI